MEGIQEEIRCSSVVELRKEEGEGGREAWGSMDLAVIVVSPVSSCSLFSCFLIFFPLNAIYVISFYEVLDLPLLLIFEI